MNMFQFVGVRLDLRHRKKTVLTWVYVCLINLNGAHDDK